MIRIISHNVSLHTKLYFNNSTTLTVDDHALDNDINLYPNPVRDVFNINLKDSQELEKVQIFDISGRQVVSVAQSRVNVNHLSAGMYIVTLRATNGEQGSKK